MDAIERIVSAQRALAAAEAERDAAIATAVAGGITAYKIWQELTKAHGGEQPLTQPTIRAIAQRGVNENARTRRA